MNDAAAIHATYDDYKRVKTRKVHQIIFEVPSERWPEVYAILGEPDTNNATWFAIAKMNGPEPEPSPPESNLAANCALMCKEPAFQKFMSEKYPDHGILQNEEGTIRAVKVEIWIESRSELNSDPDAAARWRDLRADYEAWLRF